MTDAEQRPSMDGQILLDAVISQRNDAMNTAASMTAQLVAERKQNELLRAALSARDAPQEDDATPDEP